MRNLIKNLYKFLNFYSKIKIKRNYLKINYFCATVIKVKNFEATCDEEIAPSQK